MASGGGEVPDLLDRLRSRTTSRPVVDAGLAGGLRAWLEDGVAEGLAGGIREPILGPTREHRRLVVRDGERVSDAGASRPHVTRSADLRPLISRTIFRLVVTAGPLGHPFEDALCAISVTDHGAEILEAVRRLHRGERAALRAFARTRASAVAAQWPPVPAVWLPRTGERLRVPLAGGAVSLTSSADLVLGRPSDGTASVCLVRMLDGRRGPRRAEAARRTRRALALVETLRSGAPPWRVATYEPDAGVAGGAAGAAGAGHLCVEDASEELLADAVRDVHSAVGAVPWVVPWS